MNVYVLKILHWCSTDVYGPTVSLMSPDEIYYQLLGLAVVQL